ncbi:MAG: FIVAR domain-containing protein [Clostridia bacterium]|nr:FIVAR domain-containing protein [Clostridia bacterium]
MKTSKKILSIVLAVMLLVGTVVVGASAETMVFEKAGSKLVYTATASKAANAEGFIEVEPGETITVSVYAQANYYLGTTGSEIFCWTAGFFNPFSTSDVEFSNYVNNYDCTPNPVKSNKATQLGTGYDKGTHEGFHNLRAYSTDCESPFDASEATLGYTFTFTVPESATPGATGEFRMPETCSATVATTSRMRQIYAAVNNSDSAYGNSSLGSEYPETIDLTGTILNFKVASAEAPEVPCDYEELDAAIAAYEAKLADKDLYENWADYEAAYDAAKAVARDMIVDEAGANQATIDAAADALNAVVLVYKAADYAAVEAAKAQIPADLDDGIYTSASVKAVEDAVAAVVEGYDITKQAEVDAFAAAIEDAVANLDKLAACDYAALDAAIAKTPEYGEEYYDAADWAAYEDALAAAQAVERDMIADEAGVNQAKINAAKSALDAAYTALVPKFVDRSALEAAIAQTPEYDVEYYDPAAYAAWQEAVTAGRDTYESVEGEADTEDFRNEVAAATDAINNAFAKLVAQYMDYSALEKAVADYGTTPEAADAYTSETYDAYEEALFAAKDYLVNKDDEAGAFDEDIAVEVAATAKALEDAFNNLKLKEYCDYSALEEAVANCSSTAPAEYYDAAEYAEWQAALAAAQSILEAEKLEKTDANQALIDNAAAALEKEYNDLVEQYVDLTDLANAITACGTADYEEERYTTDSWAAYEAALAAAEKAVIDYDNAPDTQAIRDIVAEAKDNLVAAYNALELNKVDCSALEAALEETPEYGEEYYPVDKWAAYEKAVADGTAALAQLKSADDTDENREAVQAATDDIINAISALVPEFIDYSALEKAVADYGTTPEAADAYTPETYDAYEEALFAANDILANKDENAPASDAELAAEIAAAAKALEDAYNALELKPIVAIVTNVTTKEEYFQVGDTVEFDYLVSITGITKLQVKFTSGTTMTYTRTHSLVTITDNGDGTETWTIATPIFADSVSAVAKAKLGKVWEEGGYPFSYQTKKKPTPTEDIEVKSVTILNNDVAVDSFTTKDTVVVRIVAGPDTLRMRLVSEGGSTSTYTRDKAYQDENGNWVWDITTHRTTAKSYKFDIYTAGKNNRLVDEGTDLTYTVTAPVVYVGPSTGNNADIVISATVAKTRLLVGDKQTVTVVTDKDALGVRIVDAEGDVHYQTKDTTLAVDNGDGTLTWTFNVGCGYAATFNFDVQALYKNQWLNNGTTLTYRVVY